MHTEANHGADMMQMATEIAGISTFLPVKKIDSKKFIASQRESAWFRMQKLFLVVDDEIFRCFRQEFTLHGYPVCNLLFLPHSLSPQMRLEKASGVFSPHGNQLRLEPVLNTLLVCHVDHRAGRGAVDNASGMAVAEKTLELCHDEGMQGVGLLACDGEESGREGSKEFLSVLRLIADNRRTNIVNFDSIGMGNVVELHPEHAIQPRVSSKNVPRIHLPGPNTDADTFHWQGYPALTFSTLDASLPKNFMDCNALPQRMAFETFSKGNVCNSERDATDALSQENMERALAVAMDLIRGHQVVRSKTRRE